MRCIRPLLLVVLAFMAVSSLYAHEVRPGYLEIRQRSAETFDVLWKVPAKGEYRLRLHARLPEQCSGAANQGTFIDDAFIERWQARCTGGLVGTAISIEGLEATRTDVLARVEFSDGTTQTTRLTPELTSFTVAAAPGVLEILRTYFWLGVEHILLGVDHLLFVFALLFLVTDWRRLIGTVTAFTVAHSVTLAAATLGFVHVAQAPVEATIALSIMFVAAEIIHGARGEPGLASRAPWVVAFVFGLLHGFGFAGALREIGLPQTDVPWALLAFNVGVEAGQLLFVGVAIAVLSLLTRWMRGPAAQERGPWHAETLIRTPVAYVIGSIAAFWAVQRVLGF